LSSEQIVLRSQRLYREPTCNSLETIGDSSIVLLESIVASSSSLIEVGELDGGSEVFGTTTKNTCDMWFGKSVRRQRWRWSRDDCNGRGRCGDIITRGNRRKTQKKM
jgi:hypothetical protein